MLPHFDQPPVRYTVNNPDGVNADRAIHKEKQIGKYGKAFILILFLAIIGWGISKILPYIPGIPQYVKLKSALYLRSANVYRYDKIVYDPDNAPLAPEWTSVTIDRESKQAIFKASSGEENRVALGESQWIQSCENQFLVESFTLPDNLKLGSVTFQKPILITVCEMWAVGEKVRPGRLVIMDAALLKDAPFFFGMQCYPQQMTCMSFAEKLGNLFINVIDSNTRLPLTNARIILTSGFGIQELYGSFTLPIYTAMQSHYQINLAGYQEKEGEISNYYGIKLEIMYWANAEHSWGSGATFDLTEVGQQVDYSIELVKE